MIDDQCQTTSTHIKTLDTLSEKIAQQTASGWQAKLHLGFEDRQGKTVIRQRQQSGPLAIQRPLYPEGGVCHTYLLHPPGGVVGGDTLSIHIDVNQNAEALITTPGATKFYRSDGRYAYQTQQLSVKSGAQLEWFPLENIFFPSSHTRLSTRIDLDADARFIGWELHCFGRPALKEGFTSGHLIGQTEIFLEGKRLLCEGLQRIGADELMQDTGMLGFSMLGTLYIRSDDEKLFELAQGLLKERERNIPNTNKRTGIIAGISQIEGLIVVRALANWSQTLMATFIELWQLCRQYWTGIAPHTPRIWAT